MTYEMILGALAAMVVAIAGAFGIGHVRGKSNAELEAQKQRTKDFEEGLKKAQPLSR